MSSKDEMTRDEVLRKMLKTPPAPFTPKAKKTPTPSKSEAKKDSA